MGCAEGRSPFAGSLRVSLRYNFFPLPGQEGGQGDGRKGFSAPHTLVPALGSKDAEGAGIAVYIGGVATGPISPLQKKPVSGIAFTFSLNMSVSWSGRPYRYDPRPRHWKSRAPVSS